MAGRARAKWLGAVQWQPRIWPHLRESERRGTSQKDGCDIHSAKSMYYSFDGRNEFIQIMLSGNPYQRGLKSSGSGHLNRQHSRQCIGPLPEATNSLPADTISLPVATNSLPAVTSLLPAVSNSFAVKEIQRSKTLFSSFLYNLFSVCNTVYIPNRNTLQRKMNIFML